ncbi:sulfite exporter TauE/SafE family protein [Candidatus Woesebacteria bacterium]|nr:sulfite exporter TauE/SafE family protein [Candidatus Woesebacteria bacterium]
MNQACAVTPHESTSRMQRILTAALIAVLMIIVYFLLSELKFLPNLGDLKLTIPVVFVLGVLASISTCMATSGALFLSTIARIEGKKVFPAIMFNVGRVGAYALFGFLLGYLGQVVKVSYDGSVALNIFVSVVMVFIGLEMLGIVSISTKGVTRFFSKIETVLSRNPKRSALFLGIFTYYLPCGFSQTVQVYALGTGNPMESMILMTAFALGTVPALMTLSFTTLFEKTNWYPWFMKVVAVVIVLVSLSYIFNTVQLYSNISSVSLDGYETIDGQVVFENGFQVVRMDVLADGYYPNTFSIQKDVPVRWILNGINVYGCQGLLNVPKLSMNETLKPGENIFEFTPKETGNISFSCSTNAKQGTLNVI